jgi:hypothetical protein
LDEYFNRLLSLQCKKGGKILKVSGMTPRNMPKRPTVAELDKCGRSFPPNFLHESWNDFLYWDTQLDI